MLLMRKNGREIENVNCKMFNEQIFEIFHSPSLLPPTLCSVQQATNRSKAGETIFKVPKMENIFHSTAGTRHFGAHATHASSNFPRSSIDDPLLRHPQGVAPARAHDSFIIMQFAPHTQCELCVFTQNACNRSMVSPGRVSDS